jgi:hypothetical protein
MPLTKLQFQPGINRETTSYSNEGGWFDCDKVRFRYGFPEKIGGWDKKTLSSYLGSVRSLHAWVALSGEKYLGLGSHLKYYIEEGGAFNDITPVRSTTSAGDVTFSATNGSSTITVTDSNHDAIAGDFVTFSGAASLGGNITADVLNQEYQIDEILTASTYTFTAREAGTTIASITVDGELLPSEVTANSSDTGNGGASAVGEYQLNIGLDTVVAGTGWGAGVWSRGTWGSGTTLTATTDILRIWSEDNFGEDLIFNVRDGGIYYWDKSAQSAPFTRAVALNEVQAEPDSRTPTIAKQVLVSDIDRHVLVFGADPLDNIGTQDPLLIRFSDQEDPFTWTPRPDNTAGDIRLGSGSKIICATETRQQILVWTDVSLYVLQFLGPPFTFGSQLISENVTIMGPLCTKAVDDTVFWMGEEDFYIYDGRVRTLPCDVKAYVFDDFNFDQKEKVVSGLNSSFNEIWWFYPSADSDINNRYVVYNYMEKVWYYGNLSRTQWLDRGINDYPLSTGTDGYLYFHELGLNDGEQQPPVAIDAYIESAQIDIGDGDSFSFVRRIIPDVTFADSTAESPTVDFILKARNFPGGNYRTTDSSAVSRTATVPVEQFTEQSHVRLRGRSMALRIESDDLDVHWRLGTPRIDLRRDGRR